MNCEKCKDNLVLYVEGLLAEPERDAMESHIETCPPCRTELQQTSSLRDRLIAGREIAAQNNLEDTVMRRISHKELRTHNNAYINIHLRRNIMGNRISKFAAMQ